VVAIKPEFNVRMPTLVLGSAIVWTKIGCWRLREACAPAEWSAAHVAHVGCCLQPRTS
jgi:hypothetical protein